MNKNDKNYKNESLSNASVSFSKLINKKKRQNIEHSKSSVKSISSFQIKKSDISERTLEVENRVSDRIRENVKRQENLELLNDIENKKIFAATVKQRILDKRSPNKKEDFISSKKNISYSKNSDYINELFSKFDIEATIEKKVKTKELNFQQKSPVHESNYDSNHHVNVDRNPIVIHRNTIRTEETPFISEYDNEIFNDIDDIIDQTLEEITQENYTSPLREKMRHSFKENEVTNNSNPVFENNDFDETTNFNENDSYEYVFPSDNLLDDPEQENFDMFEQKSEIKENVEKLNYLFQSFGLKAKVVGYQIGPTVTIYEIYLEPGQKISKLKTLEDNIKISLSVKNIRFQIPIPGKTLIGIDIPNRTRRIVSFGEVFKDIKYGTHSLTENNSELSIFIGQDLFGKSISFDLAKAPHLLVAGSTGSGKSIAINAILISLLMNYSPKELKLLLIDPKMVEFTPYHDIPHLITPIITNVEKAIKSLKIVVEEMEKRYRIFSSDMSRNINEYNKKHPNDKIPFIVIVVDELSDLMMSAWSKKGSKRENEVETSIVRITQKARAAGIHIIIATQRPSVDVITGLIKANIPSRIAFTTSSSIDSRTILDSVGAEKLVGQGDMLISLYGQQALRGQGCYISSNEIERVTNFVRNMKFEEQTNKQSKEEYVALSLGVLCRKNEISINLIAKELGVELFVANEIINELLELGVMIEDKKIQGLFIVKDGVCE